MPELHTGIGTSTEEAISLLGHDLAGELIGQVSFGELAYWLLTRRRPTPEQLRVFEAVLVALADHGLTPTAIAARLTFYSAPDAVQGALAAGLLGGGSRFLGVTEDTGRFLADALGTLGDTTAWEATNWDAAASAIVAAVASTGAKLPGFGHPVHKAADPRTPVLVQIAAEAGGPGDHLTLLLAIERVHATVIGRRLPLNAAGVSGAMLADAGIPVPMLRSVALLARTAGLIGHIAEEAESPLGPDIYRMVDRSAVYAPPTMPA